MASRTESAPARTVDEYIARAPRNMQASLRDLRRAIKSASPEAQETIAWRMPCYKYHGMLVFFAAFENHMSFFPASKSTVDEFGKELKAFEISGTTIHFTPEKPLPTALVKRMVRARMRENESLAKQRRAKRELSRSRRP